MESERQPRIIVLCLAGVAAVLALLALIPTDFWMLGGEARRHPQDLRAAIEWFRMASAVLAIAMALLCVIPKRSPAFWIGVLFALPFICMGAFLSFKSYAGIENAVYLRLVKEDGVVEDLTALFFLGASVVSGYTAIRLIRKQRRLAGTIHAALMVLTLFMCLEEISYGQRFFGFKTPPTVAAENTQGEFNLHNERNLRWIADDLAPGLIIDWGLFGWLAPLLAGVVRLPVRLREALKLGVPPWYLAPCFLPFAIWSYHSFYPGLWRDAIWQDQEPAEMFLALAFFLFAAFAMRFARSLQPLDGQQQVSAQQ